MGVLLSTYTSNKDNNFNLVRFIAASLVLFSHSFALALGSSKHEPLGSAIGMTWGSIAVDIFFVTSGFLITSSYLSRKNLIAFTWARILRIYPALVVAIIFCVFVIGLLFTSHTTLEYLQNPQTYRYFVKNIVLFFGVEFGLPGVFLNTPLSGGVNGSLWTLPYEVKMYTILGITLVLTTYIGKRINYITNKNIILIIGIFSVCLHIYNYFQPILPMNFVKLFSMFFVGATFFVYRSKIKLSSKWVAIGFTLLLMSAVNKDTFFVIYYLLLPFLVFYIAYVPSGAIRKFNKFGDYSYGMYIYAFPVQQTIAELVPNVAVSTMFIVAFFFTLFLSMLSWHLIEKRFLKMKEGYVHIETYIGNLRLTKCFSRE